VPQVIDRHLQFQLSKNRLNHLHDQEIHNRFIKTALLHKDTKEITTVSLYLTSL
jgi:hypothetical protein